MSGSGQIPRPNDWSAFWAKEFVITKEKSKAFYNNYVVIKRILRSQFETIYGRNSLEAGCGRGVISKYLMLEGMETSGMDIMQKFQHFNTNFIHEDIISIGSGDLQKLGKFDLVFTYGLLEHFGPDGR
ncbi:unnamed protein product, partial [marine sediment metagenome]